jgi:hypothetical protein
MQSYKCMLFMSFRTLTLLFSTLLFTGCGLFSNPDKQIFSLFENEPNEQERLYYNLAGALASEKPCYLISPDSYTVSPGTAPFNRSGNVVRLYRSGCFHNVARLSLRPELCEHVRTGSTILYSGTDMNKELCREDVAARQRISGNILELSVISEIVEKAGLSDSEVSRAMLELDIFPDLEVLNAYRAEREEQYTRCAIRYVIYSELFFKKIDDFQNFGTPEHLERMKQVEWQEHPFIRQPGFTHCFLADGANRWMDRGVGTRTEREPSGIQIPAHR